MDSKHKEFVDEVTSSEYFDFLIEKSVKNKTIEIIKAKKWIITLVTILIGIISGVLGYQILDINSSKEKLKDELDSLRTQIEASTVEIERKRSLMDLQLKKMENSESNMAKESSLYEKYFDFYTQESRDLNNRLNAGITKIDILSDTSRHLNTSTNRKLKDMSEQIRSDRHKLNEIVEGWRSDLEELKKNLSTVYAYVERGNDRYPGSKEFRPKFVDLPFSTKTLQITFNREQKKREKSQRGDYFEEVKEAELFLTVFDSVGKKLFQDVFTLRESSPKPIPETNHRIEAKFIYLPPNPWITSRIPDFVILAISLQRPSSAS